MPTPYSSTIGQMANDGKILSSGYTKEMDGPTRTMKKNTLCNNTLRASWRRHHLDLPTVDLYTLDTSFTEEEVIRAINLSPQDKAPGPDGFTGIFFAKTCWTTIKPDVLVALNSIHNLLCEPQLIKEDQHHPHIKKGRSGRRP